MKQLDVYYRALLGYREQTQLNKDCVSDSRAVIKANADSDKIVLTRKHCIINEDWVDTIEEGLKYIAKAIAEERQFIYSNGQTVPIEKVKNVSKDSVVHLAKHSNLITREIPGQDVIPDQLYTVEKLNDYAVYENRFLYMLLCYLRDFITIRYNKILELSNTYNGTMTMKKVVKTANRTMRYSVDFAEEKRDDEYLKETNQAKDIINRIDLLLKTVISFFSTPLMQFVSKSPMIKPPITKTNVLKMNNNFKQALNLYGYVVSYDGDGYTVETEIKELSPFSETVAEEMSETILLSSFITYEHSLGIEDKLKREYELEEQRRKDQALKEFREKLEAARLRVQKSEMSMEEYILMLEKHVRALEKKAKELDVVRRELEETKNLLDQTIKENEELKANLERTINELEAEKLRYITDMAAIKLAHEEEIKNLVTEYEDKIAQIIEAHANEIREINEKHENEIRELNDEHARQITSLNEAHANEINLLNETHQKQVDAINEAHEQEKNTLIEKHESELAAKDDLINSLKDRIALDKASHEAELIRLRAEHTQAIAAMSIAVSDMSAKLDTETTERRYLKAQYLALKKETGKLTEEDDHITQLKFDELQRTFELFKEFYDGEWSKAKSYIRHDILSKIFKRKRKADTAVAEEQAASPSSENQAPQAEPTASVPTPSIDQERCDTAPDTVDAATAEDTPTDAEGIMSAEAANTPADEENVAAAEDSDAPDDAGSTEVAEDAAATADAEDVATDNNGADSTENNETIPEADESSSEKETPENGSNE